MRVLGPKLLAVLDPVADQAPGARAASGASSGRSGFPVSGTTEHRAAAAGGPRSAACSSATGGPYAPVRSAGASASGHLGHASHYNGLGARFAGAAVSSQSGGNAAGNGLPRSSAVTVTPPPSPAGGAPQEETGCTAWDLVHTERGFLSFEQWYWRLLPVCVARPQAAQSVLGILGPQASCPPSAVHEHAFAEIVRAFADCSESEAMDLFDLLDQDLHGMVNIRQVYMAVCLLTALACRRLTRFLFLHSTLLFGMMCGSCRQNSAPDRVTWAKVLVLLRLWGTPSRLLSKAFVDYEVTPLTPLSHGDFLDITFPVAQELDRGANTGEVTVINEHERAATVRSRMCVLL